MNGHLFSNSGSWLAMAGSAQGLVIVGLMLAAAIVIALATRKARLNDDVAEWDERARLSATVLPATDPLALAVRKQRGNDVEAAELRCGVVAESEADGGECKPVVGLDTLEFREVGMTRGELHHILVLIIDAGMQARDRVVSADSSLSVEDYGEALAGARMHLDRLIACAQPLVGCDEKYQDQTGGASE